MADMNTMPIRDLIAELRSFADSDDMLKALLYGVFANRLEQQADELDFLRFFYDTVDHPLGPASDDVYHAIKADYNDMTGKAIPEGYRDGEE